jgi:DnaD/phage-associated family protein
VEEKNGFVFYRSFYEAISKVSSKETKEEIFEAICELGLNDNVVELDDSIGQIIMDLIKPQLQANNKKYEDGKKGGRPPKKTTGYEEEKTTGYENKKPKEKEKEKEKVKEKVKVKEKDIFISTTTTNKNNIFVIVEKEFGRTLSSTEIEKIIELEDEYGTDKLKLAIKECCLNNVKKIAYLNGILKNWKDKTLDEIKNEKLSETQPKLSVSQQEIDIADYDWVNADED